MSAGSFTADVTDIRNPTTCRLMESMLADEEEHADDIVDLLGA
jgi:bacterioferritin (cytochrome b1)